MLTCRVFPNGEFSIWEEKKNLAVEPPPEKPDFLGLSLLPNSHRVALGLAEPPPKRAKRGLKGISRHGARMVRNAAFLIQQRYGRHNLTFLTCTIPAVSETEQYEIALAWPEIVRKFVQSVKRLLRAAGLTGSVVGCTEIQGKRYEKYGGMPLHLHLVMVGKKPGQGWAIGADQWRSLWRNALRNEVGGLDEVSFASSVDCQRVKKDAAGYLGKYMSKGPGQIAAMVEADPGIAEFIPATWWICSLKLRRAVGARMSGGQRTARRLMKDVREGDSRVEFASEVRVQLADGSTVVAAIVGKLSAEGRSRYAYDGSFLKQLRNENH